MKKKQMVAFIGSALVLCSAFTACKNEKADGPSVSTGITMQALVAANNTDVASMQTTIQQVDCVNATAIGDPVVEVSPLMEYIPGSIPQLQDMPFDADSWHLFADTFGLTDAGCYNVTVVPLDDTGEPSEQCNEAVRNNVVVNEGEVTEVLLISQCAGQDPGALDVIAALNRDPVLEDVSFLDNKFGCVGEPINICATGSEQDADPMEFELVAAADCAVTPTVIPDPQDSQPLTQCWDVTCTDPGQASLTVNVYDMLWANGVLQRYEEYFDLQGNPQESRASLALWAYPRDCGAGGAGGASAGGASAGGASAGGVSAGGASAGTSGSP